MLDIHLHEARRARLEERDQERDRETGLDYFGARYYDASVGRFLSVDPELVGHEPGSVFERLTAPPTRSLARLVGPANINGYQYALNQPSVVIDENGESPYLAVAALVAYVAYEGYNMVSDISKVAEKTMSAGDKKREMYDRLGEPGHEEREDEWRKETEEALKAIHDLRWATPGTSHTGPVPTSRLQAIGGKLLTMGAQAGLEPGSSTLPSGNVTIRDLPD